VERFRVDSGESTLIRDYTVEDPLYLSNIVEDQDLMAFSNTPYEPYNCVELSGENNVRPE
jgi:hypothetical protein